MKIFALSTFISLAVASASSPDQAVAHRLRGKSQVQDVANFLAPSLSRKLQCNLQESTTCISGDGASSYEPTSYASGIVIDGTFNGWDTSCDGIPMHEAGIVGDSKMLASRAYVDWDCSTSTMCVLVKAIEGVFLADDGELWLKDYGISTSKLTPKAPGIGKIYDANCNLIAWEACYAMDPDCRNDIEIHANYGEGVEAKTRTTSTGKPKGSPQGSGTIAVDLVCSCTVHSDCVVNACYATSTCNANNQCDFSVSDTNCCEVDEDCDDNETCIKAGTTDATGICQAGPFEPPQTTVSPQGGADTCDPDNCFTLAVGYSDQCATPSCDDQCKFTQKNQGSKCADRPVEESNNKCYIAHVCDGYKCVATYESVGESCGEDPSSCTKLECDYDVSDSGRTTCQQKNKPDTTVCGAEGQYGVCDAGMKCNGDGGCNVDNYRTTDFVCRGSVDVCDKPDTCSGSSYACPTFDEKYGAEHTCRPKCEDCSADEPEVCAGDQDSCPANVIMNDGLQLLAAQHNDAGTVKIVATQQADSNIEVCTTIMLLDPWQLKQVDEAIKLHMCNIESPTSSAGQYDVKVSYQDYDAENGFTYCETYAPSDTVYLAIHLDVTQDGGSTGETAWAKISASSDGTVATESDSSVTPHQFYTSGTRKGPKVQAKETDSGNTKGWGSYVSFRLCDISDECAETKSFIDELESVTTTAATSVTTAVTTTAPADWNCSNGASTLTCAEKPTCNLFVV